MTYYQLLELLSTMSHEQLKMDVTAYNSLEDEYFMCKELKVTNVTDVLDKNHPYITF